MSKASLLLTIAGMKRSRPEIMAPVGSFESLAAALNAGADSVYFGIAQLNMRARAANNFTLENVAELVEQARGRGVKTYLTLNTVLYDHDLNLMQKIIDRVAELGIDAVIISDIAAMVYAREKGVTVHASTQLSISNIESVRFFAQFCDTIVLARELDLMMIKKITQEIREQRICGPSGEPVRIEIFVHGALCLAQSGRCHMSLMQYNASANRGACLQNCRRQYLLTDKETGEELAVEDNYILSPKDLCSIGFVDQLIEAGVEVFKLEGRGRSADYVDRVVQVYREAVEAVEKGEYTLEAIEGWEAQLKSVFHRGLSAGYYLGKPFLELSGSYGSQATEERVFVGKINHYFSKRKVAELSIQSHEIKVGDRFVAIGTSTGVVRGEITELRRDDKSTVCGSKSEIVTFPVSEALHKNDKFYVLTARNVESVAHTI